MVGSSLTSLLARSGVSLDFDLESVCQEPNSRQQLDEKTAEGYYMLWRCYSSRRGVDARISKPGGHDLSTPLMSLASSISLGQVCRLKGSVPESSKGEGDLIVFLVWNYLKQTLQISRWASVAPPLDDVNLKLKDLELTTSSLAGELLALLCWASGMEQR